MTFREVIKTSQFYFNHYDDKNKRAYLDIISTRMKKVKNYSYNRSTRAWEQDGNFVKILYNVRSKPISYKPIDNKIHSYPVLFWIKNIKKGLDSKFRYRCGSLFKPAFPNPGSSKQARQMIAKRNQLKKIELDFFFNLEWALWVRKLLYGPNWAQWPPKEVKNIKQIPYFCKHSWTVLQKHLIPIFTKNKQAHATPFATQHNTFVNK